MTGLGELEGRPVHDLEHLGGDVPVTGSVDAFRGLAEDGRGLPAIAEFFDALIGIRCTGEHARWGCMISNAQAGAENGDPDVRAFLDQHHKELRAALHAVLVVAGTEGQLAPGTDPATAADLLTLLAYGVNLRSRAGADAGSLRATVTAALRSLGCRTPQ
ncbi:TetR family transcriptional regulator C-terminal domain-containing protein [Streptomyces sp. NPDC101234]|uniref:TetR family transcriptional regulator C-terminal domain-containing protein n=1 Tax=Streptomyces sp. NPDC101234 TaxID=3366138 RepID=UPI00380F2A29